MIVTKKIKKSKSKLLTPFLLDIGCGDRKSGPHWIGMDKRKLDGVDVVHDIEDIPYPFESNSVTTVMASHVLEHIKPWLTLDVFNEIWRILKPEGQLAIGCPYGVNEQYVQDPTHCNPFNEVTFFYFDPMPEAMGWKEVKNKKTGIYEVKQIGVHNKLYDYYAPQPWKIEMVTWKGDGNLEVILEKRRR